MKHKLSRISKKIYRLKIARIVTVVLFVIVGTYFIILSHAATPYVATTAATGTLASGASVSTCVGSSDNCVVFNTAPASPTNLSVLDSSTTEVSLSWSPPSGWTAATNNITGYNIYRDGSSIPIATTKPFTTNYLDTGLAPGSSHTYTVEAVVGTASSAPTSAVSATLGSGATAIPESSCPSANGDTIGSGNYVLTQNVSFSSNDCFTASKVNNVNIDCQGYTITATASVDEFMRFVGVNHSMVVNCNFQITVPSFNRTTINFYDNGFNNGYLPSDYNTVENNTFGNSSSASNYDLFSIVGVSVDDSVIDNNTMLNGYISLAYENLYSKIISDNNQINANNLSMVGEVSNLDPGRVTFGYVINIQGGSNDTAAYNIINGNGTEVITPIPGTNNSTITLTGVDAGFYLSNSTNAAIEYNQLSNFWDCGIEISQTNADLDFSGNSISNAVVCGFGGWYQESLSGSNFSNNTVNDSGGMFDFNLEFEDGGTPSDAGTYNFYNNTFKNNTYSGSGPTNCTNCSYTADASMDFVNQPNVVAEGIIISAYNNVFINNNLEPGFNGNNPSPFQPLSMIVDGGGNQWCPSQPPLVNSSQCH